MRALNRSSWPETIETGVMSVDRRYSWRRPCPGAQETPDTLTFGSGDGSLSSKAKVTNKEIPSAADTPTRVTGLLHLTIGGTS
jgi:hypothetical protein